jgi:hypothetical protein
MFEIAQAPLPSDDPEPSRLLPVQAPLPVQTSTLALPIIVKVGWTPLTPISVAVPEIATGSAAEPGAGFVAHEKSKFGGASIGASIHTFASGAASITITFASGFLSLLLPHATIVAIAAVTMTTKMRSCLIAKTRTPDAGELPPTCFGAPIGCARPHSRISLTQPECRAADSLYMKKRTRFGYPGHMRGVPTELRVLVVFAIAVSGCTKHNPGSTCESGTCSDPAFPFCDVDGVVGGEPHECVAVSCTPGSFGVCDGSAALMCDATGNNYVKTPCASGCDSTFGCIACAPSSTACSGQSVVACDASGNISSSEACAFDCVDGPPAHCAHVVPKFVDDICDSPALAPTLNITSSGTLDTGFDANCNGGVRTQTAGPDLCVFHYGQISVGTGIAVALVSSRAAVLVSDGDFTVAGTIDISGHTIGSGPGGGYLFSGGDGTTSNGFGCGGAGFKTEGGSGGTATMDGGAQNGGAMALDPASLTSLMGGPQSYGAGGGGAATLISCNGSVKVTGKLVANGGGGMGGLLLGSTPTPGGAGGAGGYFVLQGLDVVVTGEIYANGGAGGAGQVSAATGRYDGSDGTQSDTVGAQGGQSPNGGGNGGRGGSSAGGPGVGTHPTVSGGTPGGGGGSVGFFQAYTPAGVTPTLTPSHASPNFQPSLTVETR